MGLALNVQPSLPCAALKLLPGLCGGSCTACVSIMICGWNWGQKLNLEFRIPNFLLRITCTVCQQAGARGHASGKPLVGRGGGALGSQDAVPRPLGGLREMACEAAHMELHGLCKTSDFGRQRPIQVKEAPGRNLLRLQLPVPSVSAKTDLETLYSRIVIQVGQADKLVIVFK